jgi:hypothetical protein
MLIESGNIGTVEVHYGDTTLIDRKELRRIFTYYDGTFQFISKELSMIGNIEKYFFTFLMC